MTELRVSPFAGDAEQWDAFVRKQEGWTHFHLYGWRDVLASVYGHQGINLVAHDAAGSLRGVLPLCLVRGPFFGRFLVSMPFVNYGGPLGDDASKSALVSAAAALARRHKVKLLELRSRDALRVELPVSHRKITVTLPLNTGSARSLWYGFDSNVRRRINRARRAGIEVRFGADQMAPFYEVFARHMRDLGTPVHSPGLFRKVLEVFPDVWFGCAWYEGRPIAAIGGFRWAQEFEVTWASALIEFKGLAANMLLYWSFMERCLEEGVTLFNFGRCSPGDGTHRFKKQWGGQDETLWWYQDGPAAGGGTPSPNDTKYSLAVDLWKKMPLALANRLGPALVRGIP